MTDATEVHGSARRGTRNVLVVSTVEEPGELLRRYVGSDDTIKVVVPVVRQGFLDWLANDERAFAEAQEIAEETADHLPGTAVETGAGEADVELAIRDALATFPADEIVVVVHDDDHAGLVESMAIETAAQRRSIDGVPIRFVVVDPE